ncbi:ATP-binding protein [Chloroflexota bacterium]
MKEVLVISGKGGTGKTTIVASLAALAQSKVMVDCDVDAADLNLLLQPDKQEKYEFWSGQTAVIDPEKCSRCGLCQDVCRFNAISEYCVDPVYCEGCSFCYNICPEEAIIMRDNLAGNWFVSSTKYGTLVHARLGIAEENSGKLVATVRKQARDIARDHGLDFILSDGPPGIGCPVISSLSGTNLAVIVTEPTLSGIHDMERVIGVCRHFKVPAMVCINKYDINETNTGRIQDYCDNNAINVAARIPYDNIVNQALVRRQPVVEYTDNGVSRQIKSLWAAIYKSLTS